MINLNQILKKIAQILTKIYVIQEYKNLIHTL